MSVDDFLVWSNRVLRFVAPTIEPRAALFLRRLRIGIARHINRLATKIDAGRLPVGWFAVVKLALVTHGVFSNVKRGVFLVTEDWQVRNPADPRIHRCLVQPPAAVRV